MSLTNGTITVIFDNGAEMLTARKDHPQWNDILIAYKTQDERQLRQLLSMKAVVQEYSTGDLTIDGTGIVYRGRPLHGLAVERTLAFMNEGIPYKPMAEYLNRLQQNPSSRSIVEFYKFFENKNLTMTPKGTIIAYKGVRQDFYSIMGNKNTIVIQGTVDDNGHIFNGVGETIEVERSSVDDDFTRGCSHGLHVGSLEYAISYARPYNGIVILVEFDPAYAVCVPSDEEHKKLRLCKYKVVGQYAGPLPNIYTSEFSDDENNGEETTSEISEQFDESTLSKILEEMDKLEDPIDYPSSGTPNSQEEPEAIFTGFPCDLEKAAQDAGILPKSINPEKSGDPDEYETDFLHGMKKGIDDRCNNKPAQYLMADKLGADSPRHAEFIEGYVEGYTD